MSLLPVGSGYDVGRGINIQQPDLHPRWVLQVSKLFLASLASFLQLSGSAFVLQSVGWHAAS